MRFCWLILIFALFVGCSNKDGAEFASSARMRTLMPQARKTVIKTVDAGFGTPQELVAWRKLDGAVDFGTLTGVVTETSDDDRAYKIKVNFLDSDGQPTEIDAHLFKGQGILFLSGKYQAGAVKVTSRSKGGPEYVGLQVHAFDAESETLTLRQKMEPPPQEGDEFVVVGHTLQQGRKLYMHHCMHCHGVAGDGNGPTAEYLNPLPRDYRTGVFKFTSTRQGFAATRDDMKRIVKIGIPGTYMPSFMLLENDELKAIVEYVRFLAIRGQFENGLITETELDYSKEALGESDNKSAKRDALDEFIQDELPEYVDGYSTDIAQMWADTEKEENRVPSQPGVPRVADTKESRDRGYATYIGKTADCISCHGPAGRGNGRQTEQFLPRVDDPSTKYEKRGLHDGWGHPIKPRNLTTRIFRGGRRPVDIYRRISEGIKGTPMAGFGQREGAAADTPGLSPEQIWDVVNFVLSIPYEGAQRDVKIASSEPIGKAKVDDGPADKATKDSSKEKAERIETSNLDAASDQPEQSGSE